MTLARPDDVLHFWLEDCDPSDWYRQSDALDEAIRSRFGPTLEVARSLSSWCATPRGTLAFLILTDQFPRNMFRGDGRAFATDGLALSAAKAAVGKGFDRRIDAPARQFFYLPMEHSESLPDQARAVRLTLLRLGPGETLLHAVAHREVIRTFGRFPYRNDALGRHSSEAEREMLAAGGYGAVLRRVQDAGTVPG